MIESGEKRVEARLSRTKRAPYGMIARGQTVFIKKSGGEFVCRSLITHVEQHENLSPNDIKELESRYSALCDPRCTRASKQFWASKEDARYAVFVWFGSREKPVQVPKVSRQYGGAWLTIAGDSA